LSFDATNLLAALQSGELTGVGDFAAVRSRADEAEMLGGRYLFIDLETLITAKRAAGRPKDLETIAELEAIREERDASS
jgi:hypothetical protein